MTQMAAVQQYTIGLILRISTNYVLLGYVSIMDGLFKGLLT